MHALHINQQYVTRHSLREFITSGAYIRNKESVNINQLNNKINKKKSKRVEDKRQMQKLEEQNKNKNRKISYKALTNKMKSFSEEMNKISTFSTCHFQNKQCTYRATMLGDITIDTKI